MSIISVDATNLGPKNSQGTLNDLVSFDHYLIKERPLLCLSTLNSRGL